VWYSMIVFCTISIDFPVDCLCRQCPGRFVATSNIYASEEDRMESTMC
jgi:hypothetical protein